MSKANELALRAYEEAQKQKEQVAREELSSARQWEMDAQQEILDLIPNTPLNKWFPDVTWEVYHIDKTYGCFLSFDVDCVLVPADRPGGTNPERCTITLGFKRDCPGKIFWVNSVYYEDSYSTSWWGVRVNSAADVGRHLARQRERLEAKGEWLG